jgi:actin beta/gamma 1
MMAAIGLKNFYLRNEAQLKKGILNLQHPINHGIVTNWNNIKKL